MKRIISLVLVMVFALCFVSCSKSADTDNSGSASETSASEASQGMDAIIGKTLVNTEDDTNTYIFNADGTCVDNYKGNALNGKWTFDENDNHITVNIENVESPYNFYLTMDGNSVTGMEAPGVRTFTIK